MIKNIYKWDDTLDYLVMIYFNAEIYIGCFGYKYSFRFKAEV